MSRRHRAEKREVLPDPTFGDILVTKFMNVLMIDGKKSAAEKIVYGAFDRISGRTGQEGVQVFHEALENVRPQVEVRSRRVGGATYQVPVEVRSERAQASGHPLADQRVRNRSENTMTDRWQTNCWTPQALAGPRSRSAKTRTVWPKPTRRSRTTAGKFLGRYRPAGLRQR